MSLKAINHITINMVDLEKSFWFYGDVLGLPKLEEADMGDHYIYYYQLPGGTKLELLRYKYETETVQPQNTSKGIYRHFALETDDIGELYDLFAEKGIEVVEKPGVSEVLKVKYMLIKDPNGVEVEFVECL